MATLMLQKNAVLEVADEPMSAGARRTSQAEPNHTVSHLAGVTVIIPCFNEETMAVETVRRIVGSFSDGQRPLEVIVVDDGSTNRTTESLEAMAKPVGVKVIRNDRNRGYGFSIKRAVAMAAHELIVITDADGTYPNERIPELVELMADADMVVGARTGDSVHIPLVRRPAKWALRRLAAYLTETEIPDLNSGLRVMRRSLIRRFQSILPDGFSLTTTITLALLTHGHTVRFVPINYAKRIGSSSIRPIRDTLNFLSLIVRTVLYFKPLKIFAPTSAIVFAIAVAIALVSKFVFGQLADVTCVTLASAAMQLLAIGLLADLIDKRSPRATFGA